MRKIMVLLLSIAVLLSGTLPKVNKVSAAGQSNTPEANTTEANTMSKYEREAMNSLKASAAALHSAGSVLTSSAQYSDADGIFANLMVRTGQSLIAQANSMINTANSMLPSNLLSGAASTDGSTEAMSQAQQSLSERWSLNEDVVTRITNFESESTVSTVHIPGNSIMELINFLYGTPSNGNSETSSISDNYKPDADHGIVGAGAIGQEGLSLIDALMLEAIQQAENIFTEGSNSSQGSTENNGNTANEAQGTDEDADTLGNILSEIFSMFTEYSDMVNQMADTGQEIQQFLQGMDPEMQQQIISELNLNDVGNNGGSPDTDLPYTYLQAENESFNMSINESFNDSFNESFSLLPQLTQEQLEQIANMSDAEYGETFEAFDTIVDFVENLGNLFGDNEESDSLPPSQNTQQYGTAGGDNNSSGNETNEEGNVPSGGGDLPSGEGESAGDSTIEDGDIPSGENGGDVGSDGGTGVGGNGGASGTAGAGIAGNSWFGGYTNGEGGLDNFSSGMLGNTSSALADPNFLGIAVKKPNIYLYSPVENQVNISFAGPTRIIESIPKYDFDIGWNVKVSPDGTIDGKYYYLFYEAMANEKNFQKERGWIISHQNRSLVFKKILNNYGFNNNEIKDFIEFWNSALALDKDYRMYPQESEIVNRLFPIFIKPYPDNLNRIWFYFIEDSCGLKIEPPKEIERVSHNDFAVVEWGGMISDGK